MICGEFYFGIIIVRDNVHSNESPPTIMIIISFMINCMDILFW